MKIAWVIINLIKVYQSESTIYEHSTPSCFKSSWFFLENSFCLCRHASFRTQLNASRILMNRCVKWYTATTTINLPFSPSDMTGFYKLIQVFHAFLRRKKRLAKVLCRDYQLSGMKSPEKLKSLSLQLSYYELRSDENRMGMIFYWRSCRLARRTIAFERHSRSHLICFNSNWSAVVIASIYHNCLNCFGKLSWTFHFSCFWSAHCSESNGKTFKIKQKWSICNWVFMLLQAISRFSFGILFLTSFELGLETWDE